MPTPVADNSRGLPNGGSYQSLPNAVLLPTPAVNDMGRGKTLEQWDTWTDAMRERHGNGNGHGKSLDIEARRHEPYAEAITRWEALSRPAPDPVDDGRLNPRFVEWMMGLDDGYVAGVSRTAQLKMLGNGVVPQQALLALQCLDPREGGITRT